MRTRELIGGLSKAKTVQAQLLNLQENIVQESFLPEPKSPIVLSCTMPGVDLGGWMQKNKPLVARYLNQYGGILFRNFGVDTVASFKNFVDQLELNTLEYKMRSSPRHEVGDKIYHTTTHPADQTINMHSESSYASSWPMRVIFCCVTPAAEQGETPVADTRQVLANLGPALRAKFEQLGVLYTRNLSPQLGLPWQEVFQTTDKAEVEAICRQSNMEFEWQGEEKLVTRWRKKAVYNHPATGEPTWFNHAFFFNKYTLDEDLLAILGQDNLPFDTCFGDGSEISRAEAEEIGRAYQQALVVFPWQKGDVLFLDNMLMAHGRMPFKGARQILVSLLEPMED
ncbi:MAG: TauD/TfdA family dioxygenase [Janthinobacterium lividum]